MHQSRLCYLRKNAFIPLQIPKQFIHGYFQVNAALPIVPSLSSVSFRYFDSKHTVSTWGVRGKRSTAAAFWGV